MAASDGRGRFATSAAPAETADARAAQFIDYDNDGLLDLFLLTARGPRLLRNLGREWTDVSARAIRPAMAAALADATSLATGDLDGDGRVDFVARGPSGLAALAQRRREPPALAPGPPHLARQQPLGRRRQDRDARRQPQAAARDLRRHARAGTGRHPLRSRRSRRQATSSASSGRRASCRPRPERARPRRSPVC